MVGTDAPLVVWLGYEPVRKLLVEATGLVDARIDRVADLLLTVHAGDVAADNAWLFQGLAAHATLSGGPDRYTYQADGHSGTIELDHAQRMIAYQGGWWYRAEYALAPADASTRIVHRVYNAATRSRWAVPLVNRMFLGFPEKVRARFSETLSRIGAELGCGWRLES